MGILYTLADHRNRLFYDLDKAGGLAGALCEEGSFVGPVALVEFEARLLVRESRHKRERDLEPEEKARHKERRAYLRQVAADLHVFCEKAGWDVTLLCDAYDEEWLLRDVLGYRYSGTRMACPSSDLDNFLICDRLDCVVCPLCGTRGCAHVYPGEHDLDEKSAEETCRWHSVAEAERYVEHLRTRHLEALKAAGKPGS
jgi:hypothetical protein